MTFFYFTVLFFGGCTQNDAEAIRWFKRAAAEWNKKAKGRLADPTIARNMRPGGVLL